MVVAVFRLQRRLESSGVGGGRRDGVVAEHVKYIVVGKEELV